MNLPNNYVAKTQNLTKKFGSTIALDSVSVEILTGRITGLLGANGCGKSTLIRHLTGLYLPRSGNVLTFGTEAKKLKPAQMARIGYVHQEGELLDWMTAKQLKKYVAAYYSNWNTDLEQRYVEDFEINLKQRVGSMSPGQRQKLAILLAIGHEPDLLLLDEPASALDPIARAQFLDLLLTIIQDTTRTILISSHILSDVEKVIDHAIIMDKGKIIRDTSFDHLREEFTRLQIVSLNGPLPAELPFENIIPEKQSEKQAVITVRNLNHDTIDDIAADINCTIEANPLPLEDIYRLILTTKNS
jgi:ABC-2 type transport system ATP-binding protein